MLLIAADIHSVVMDAVVELAPSASVEVDVVAVVVAVDAANDRWFLLMPWYDRAFDNVLKARDSLKHSV